MDWRCVEANSRKRHWTVVLKQIPGSRCWSKNLNGAQVYAHTLVVSFIRWHELSAGRQGDRYELPRGRMTRHPFWNAVWLIDVAMSRDLSFSLTACLRFVQRRHVIGVSCSRVFTISATTPTPAPRPAMMRVNDCSVARYMPLIANEG
jgi:hypothetical protein